jgi:hypothetical protein
MKNITIIKADELFETVSKKCNSYNRILDIGCGIRPQTIAKTNQHICLEAHSQYIEHYINNVLSKKSFMNKNKFLFINDTIDFLFQKFPRKSVDAIFMLDVIEHLEKEYAKKVIALFEEIAINDIIIFTPYGFVEQLHPDGKDAWGLDGGKWQEHHSGWTPDDFDDSWDFYVCPDFHTSNNIGVDYIEPVGAFFAVKTINKFNQNLGIYSQVKEFFKNIIFKSKINNILNG